MSTSARLLAPVITLLAATACSAGPTDPGPTSVSAPPPTSVSAPPSVSAPAQPTTAQSSPDPQESPTVTPIRITVAGQTVTGELNDSPTARDLIAQLPVTVSLSDFNGVEKVGELPRPLTMDGVPAGADPEIDDIGYYRPSNGLVFYYGDVGYFRGIVRLGTMPSEATDLIRRQSGTFTVTLQTA